MLRIGLAAFLLLSASDRPPALQRDPLVVVVNLASSVDDFSLEQLRSLFLGRTAMVDGSHRAILAEYDNERVRFYRAALSMDEDRFKRYWIRQVFAGAAATPPETFTSVEDVKRFVAGRVGAVAFLPASAVDGTVKVVTIEGHRPTDSRYPLRD